MTLETTRGDDTRTNRRTGFEPRAVATDGSGIQSNTEQIAADLTKFQTKALLVIAAEDRYGLEIKKELEEYYTEEVLHGRLYPNLNTLVEHGLVEKTERDRRTNNYSIEPVGRRVVEYEHWHVEKYLSGDER